MKIEKKEFIKIDYTGKIAESDTIFDTTDESVAKKENIYNPRMSYGAITICIGEKQIIPGLDAELEGKELGKDYTIKLSPEHAFGKKDAKLFKLVPQNIFLKQKINPFVGLEVTIDNMPGVIRSVTGGRVYVDFNHPLAGKELIYEVKVHEKISDDKQKADSILKLMLNIADPKTELKDGHLKISENFPDALHNMVSDKIIQLVPNITEVGFAKHEHNTKHEHKHHHTEDKEKTE